MTILEDIFRKTLVFIGDLSRMDTRLNDLAKEARIFGVEIDDLPESKKTIDRLKDEANTLHDKVNDKLQ